VAQGIYEIIPKDSYLSVLVYEDGEPPRKLAYEVFEHRDGVQRQIDPDKGPKGASLWSDSAWSDPAIRHRFLAKGATLASFRALHGGDVGYIRLDGIRFEVSLVQWADADPETTRVSITVFHIPRFELFTEHHWALMKQDQERIDAWRKKQGLPTMDEINIQRVEQGLPPLKPVPR